MKVRIARKVFKEIPPSEIKDKSRTYWDRYNRAWIYIQRLHRRLLRKRRKEGKLIVYDQELDKLIDEVLNEFKNLQDEK